MTLCGELARHTGARLAEIGFLCLLIAGVWLAAGQILGSRFARARTVIAGAALGVGGLLLIVATRWGHFGS